MSKHLPFLRDFFCSYKDFTSAEIDVLEIFLEKLYRRNGITENRNLNGLSHKDYPILSDLYELMQEELRHFENKQGNIYTSEILRSLCLKAKSLCIGADSRRFNGHTNITTDIFITFGVKGILNMDESVRNAILFNILSYMSDALLKKGGTAAFIDELYLFLSNLTAIEYIRNAMKRVRKKDSAVVIASQNVEDFNREGIKEMTKPLFSIPTHQFLFYFGKDLVTITQIAKDYGMSGRQMNRKLHSLKIQYKQNEQWLLYAAHQAKGYTHSETIRFFHDDGTPDTKMVTKWTQKGRLFLYQRLKKEGILPGY